MGHVASDLVMQFPPEPVGIQRVRLGCEPRASNSVPEPFLKLRGARLGSVFGFYRHVSPEMGDPGVGSF